MRNFEIAAMFNEMAELLETKDENPFKIRAYRKAAQSLESLTKDIEDIAKQGTLQEIPGIGRELAAKIEEIISTGKLKAYEKLKKSIPAAIPDMVEIPGVGPNTAKLLYNKFKLKSVGQLEKLAKGHKICNLPNIKEKTEENILRGIELLKRSKERMPLGEALPIAIEMTGRLRSAPGVERINYAGSVRRMKETVHDIDILITSSKPKPIMDAFVALPRVRDILAHGATKSSVLLKEGIQVDLRIVEPESYGAALLYFTGSKQHNIHLRGIANDMGYKINEYGVFNGKTGKRAAGEEEESIYKFLKLSYIPPELREDAGEIEAAAKGGLPDLVELKDIRGDLHVHSEWSDGAHSIKELAAAAGKRGYEYIAVTDHSESLKVAGGLSGVELKEKIKEIRDINRKIKGLTVLAGIELDILSDGSLDIDEALLPELDIVVAAIHSGFKQGKEKLTRRIISAMKNKHVNVIAHPTSRLMGSRDAYELDFEEIFKVARETNTALEINAYPDRLDLNDINARRAKETGVAVAIGSDTHVIGQLGNMAFGVAVARRGWLEKKDVLNTLALDKLLKKIKK
ncbi:MAG: DNA polymerase/3'-5' exonuclease PolX [Candidatus Omnitrophica bacterium]|nr:DNA polymerase/3'-5' exonuclease PolX [Candidatus Omnitrophota bacterium]